MHLGVFKAHGPVACLLHKRSLLRCQSGRRHGIAPYLECNTLSAGCPTELDKDGAVRVTFVTDMAAEKQSFRLA
jgi:hypothetical protein